MGNPIFENENPGSDTLCFPAPRGADVIPASCVFYKTVFLPTDYDENTQFLGANYFNRGFRQGTWHPAYAQRPDEKRLSLQLSGHGTRPFQSTTRNAIPLLLGLVAGGRFRRCTAYTQFFLSSPALGGWPLIPGAGYTAALQHDLDHSGSSRTESVF